MRRSGKNSCSDIVVNYTDGTSQTVVSDPETWSYTVEGPVRIASMFEGEVYDATRDAFVEGYSTAEYDAWREISNGEPLFLVLGHGR